MFAAFNVGVGEFIHHDDRWLTRQDGVHIHLFEDGAFVFELSSRHGFQLGGEFGSSFAAVRFHDADQNFFAPTGAANGLTQHRVGLADSGRVAEKELQDSLGLRRRHFLQPLLR